MKNKCKRCGKCCEKIYLSTSPSELRKNYLDWNNQVKGRRDIEDVELLYPMLRYLGRSNIKGHRKFVYKCVHYEVKNDKALCGIQRIKPKMCSKFPYYGSLRKLKMGGGEEDEKPSHIEGCGFNK